MIWRNSPDNTLKSLVLLSVWYPFGLVIVTWCQINIMPTYCSFLCCGCLIRAHYVWWIITLLMRNDKTRVVPNVDFLENHCLNQTCLTCILTFFGQKWNSHLIYLYQFHLSKLDPHLIRPHIWNIAVQFRRVFMYMYSQFIWRKSPKVNIYNYISIFVLILANSITLKITGQYPFYVKEC